MTEELSNSLTTEAYPRALLKAAKERLAFSPAIVLLGPRQVGKTTLSKMIAQGYPGAVCLDLQLAVRAD